MKVTRVFKLEQAARKSGGDRYEEICAPSEQPVMGKTYINQFISRPGKVPVPILTITIETPEMEVPKS